MNKSFPSLSHTMLLLSFMVFTTSCENAKSSESRTVPLVPPATPEVTAPVLDTTDYDYRMQVLANSDTTGKWPVKTPYPLPGALLPFNRIVAYYGNLYSTRMGILGELPKDQMLEKLNGEVAKWQAADTTTKVIPALHYIAATAQSRPGNGNMYRLRMPFSQIDTILAWAKPINALVFLDVQIGHSSIREEVSALEPYLKLPNVHLGIDPEFSMKNGEAPGTRIGHFTAGDINDAIEILANVVKENKLTPKVLVIHRFTQGMVKNYQDIKIVPEVQVVMDMDGFGDKILKESSYKRYIYKEPVQFTGFKLFYKNDNKNNWKMYSPEELLKFTPKPIYIQYQ